MGLGSKSRNRDLGKRVWKTSPKSLSIIKSGKDKAAGKSQEIVRIQRVENCQKRAKGENRPNRAKRVLEMCRKCEDLLDRKVAKQPKNHDSMSFWQRGR
jgi:hypothetical protein